MVRVSQDRSAEPARVARRRVFYIPGYDPIPPRRYREIYRKEGADQARMIGYDLTLRPKRVAGPYGWHVSSCIEGAAVEADFEVLVWSDIVRDSMSQGILATYLQLLHTAWVYLWSGALIRLIWLRKGPTVAALYPVVLLVLQLVVALLVGWGLGLLAGKVAGWWGAVPAALVGAALVLRWFRRIDNRIYAHYLMHDYAYTAQHWGANPPELEARMSAFRMTLRAALGQSYDEVLVVGHSSGAHLAVSILSDLIREGVPAGGPALSFLSLGQVVPMVSFLPTAARLRGDLRYLSARDEVAWIDVTAPGDGCAFALCDPVSVTGVAPDGKRWPLVLSCAFRQTLSAKRWKQLHLRFFRMHFQYLCAFDNLAGAVDDYDYFRITAGPLTLADRLGQRPASKSRIERPASGHRSVA